MPQQPPNSAGYTLRYVLAYDLRCADLGWLKGLPLFF